MIRYCAVPGCRQQPFGLSTAGLCYAHDKEANGFLNLGTIRSARPVTKYHGPEPRPKLVRLPKHPLVHPFSGFVR